MDIEFRQSTDSDEQELILCMNEFEDYYACLETPVRKSRSPEFGQQFIPVLLKKIKSENGKIVVALDNKKIIGFAVGIIERQTELDEIANGYVKCGSILELFVKDTYRDKGIGKELVNKLESYLKESDCTKINLEVIHSNKDIVKFYNHIGYTIETIILSKTI